MPWVPRDLYELLLTALTRTESPGGAGHQPCDCACDRGSSATRGMPRGGVVATQTVGSSTPPAITFGRVSHETARIVAAEALPQVAVLAPPVLEACNFYAFGSAEDEARNVQRAETLTRAGKAPEEIVREIRQGANVDALFI